MNEDEIKAAAQSDGKEFILIEKDVENLTMTHENGETYHIDLECKIQINGEWVDGVTYWSKDGTQMYCRATTDFKKFKML